MSHRQLLRTRASSGHRPRQAFPCSCGTRDLLCVVSCFHSVLRTHLAAVHHPTGRLRIAEVAAGTPRLFQRGAEGVESCFGKFPALPDSVCARISRLTTITHLPSRTILPANYEPRTWFPLSTVHGCHPVFWCACCGCFSVLVWPSCNACTSFRHGTAR